MTITKEFLDHQYTQLNKSSNQIAKEIGVERYIVCNAMTKFCIPYRSLSAAKLPIGSSGKYGYKWCPKCKNDKRLNEFHNANRGKLKKVDYCKQCVSKKAKKYFAKNLADRQQRKVNLVLEFGNKCFDCGAENLPVCSFVFHHHSEGYKSPDYISPSDVINYKNYKDIEAEKSKWILLCANCHSVRHSIFKSPAN